MKVSQIKDLVVFSTHVEVILTITPKSGTLKSILHTCGGDPLRGW